MKRHEDRTAPRDIQRPVNVCGNGRQLVRVGRRAEARMELVCRKTAACAVGAFDHDRPGAEPGKQRGGSQSFRTRTDDCCVVSQRIPALRLPPRLTRVAPPSIETMVDERVEATIAAGKERGNGSIRAIPVFG